MRLAAEEPRVLFRMLRHDLIGTLSIHKMQVLVASGCERRSAAEGALVRRQQLYFCSDAAFFRCSRLVALALW